MKTIHFDHEKRRGHGIELNWKVLAVMMGIGLTLAIKLLWLLGSWLGMK